MRRLTWLLPVVYLVLAIAADVTLVVGHAGADSDGLEALWALVVGLPWSALIVATPDGAHVLAQVLLGLSQLLNLGLLIWLARWATSGRPAPGWFSGSRRRHG